MRRFFTKRRKSVRAVQSGQAGVAVIELVVAMTVFTIVLVAATATFVAVVRGGQKSAVQRSVQQEARYSVEEISRTARVATSPDYPFYGRNRTGPCSMDAHTTLAILTYDGSKSNRVIFYYDAPSKAIYKYQAESGPFVAPDCATIQAVVNSPSNRMTGNDVEVLDLGFFLTPTTIPNDAQVCGNDLVCQSAKAMHPRVLITATMRSTGQDAKISSTTLLQTIVSLRAYPFAPFVPPTPTPAPSASPSPGPSASPTPFCWFGYCPQPSPPPAAGGCVQYYFGCANADPGSVMSTATNEYLGPADYGGYTYTDSAGNVVTGDGYGNVSGPGQEFHGAEEPNP